MPGFFESLKRMAQGKPVFDANDNDAGWANKDGRPVEQKPVGEQPGQPAELQPKTPQEQPQGGIVKGNPSTFPLVSVRRTRTHGNGSNQDVYCSIYNGSKVAVELEDLELAGRSRRLGGRLRPGEEHEYLAYSGLRARDDHDREARLNYKVEETRDYFQTIYDVEYQLEQDGTYSVEELHIRLPVRDIYG